MLSLVAPFTFLHVAVVNTDGCGQGGSAIAVCVKANIKMPLTRDTLLLTTRVVQYYTSLLARFVTCHV